MCAINDALAPLGIQAHEVPASPQPHLEARPSRARQVARDPLERRPPRGRERSLRRTERMPLHEPRVDARDELLPGLRALVEEHRRRHARLGRRPRSRRRRGDARAARARAHQVYGQVRRRRLLRAARVDDGRRRLLDVHVDQRLHHEGDRAVPRPHVPRVQRRADSAARRRERDLGARVPGQEREREALQGLRARGRAAQRQAPVALLREGLRARHRAHHPHRHVLRVPAAEQVHAPVPARRRLPRLPRPEDHRLPHGLAASRRADGLWPASTATST